MRAAVMEEIIAELVNLFMFIGIGIFVLNDAPALLKSVIDSFRIAGKSASGAGICAERNTHRWFGDRGASLGADSSMEPGQLPLA